MNALPTDPFVTIKVYIVEIASLIVFCVIVAKSVWKELFPPKPPNIKKEKEP